MIKEDDGLPQNICVRCLGTLEFLCDFYDRCHFTQKELVEDHKGAVEEESQQESDAEFNKENMLPSPNEAKRKGKPATSENSRSTKNSLTVKSPSSENSIQPNKSPVSKKQSTANVACEERLKNEENDSDSLSSRKSLTFEKINVLKKTMIRSTKSAPMNSMNSIQNAENVITETKVRRKRGRKNKLGKMKEAALPLDTKKKIQTNLHDYTLENNQYKRQCLRAIFPDSKSNVVISPKPQVEQVTKEQLKVDAILNELPKSNDENNKKICNDGPTLNDAIEIIIDNNDCEKEKEEHVKSKAISVIVKQEKMEIESLQKTEKSDESRSSSSLEKETNQTENIEKPDVLVGIDAIFENPQSKVFAEQNRMIVIKSSLSNEVIIPDTIDDDSDKLDATTEELDDMDESTKDDLKSDISDLSLAERLRQDSFTGSKNKDKSFGKISELISDEQKQTIETYYTVDMSMVNSEEVQKNMTVIDKKNIRCNLCGTLYLRMDKCQVHIWGHLQMKPYQCKACDFSTVTVSNVRCHIRKSHLKIKPFVCHVCEKRYVTAALLEEHINTHTGARPFKCKICDFASASRQMLSYHTSTHKPMKDVACKICGKEFYSRGRLRAHMIIHNKDKVVMCKLCSSYLSNPEALETHQKNIHAQDYVCNVCGKRTKSRKALHNHQNVHAAAKYKCSLCPNVYKSSQILKEHLLKHEGIRKYKCTVCEKSFGQQSHLAAHMAVHSKIRFYCPACEKAFNRQDNMKIHTKRCKLFLSNPSLKDFLTKKEKPDNKVAIEDSKDEDSSNSGSLVEDQNENSSTKVTEDKKKTEMNLCKLGLNISCIKSVDQTWIPKDVFSEMEQFTTNADITGTQITKVNDKLIPESETLTVLENVLRPESF